MGRGEAGGQVSADVAPGGAVRRDAIELLTADHRQIEALFQQYLEADDAAQKSALVAQICLALTIHMRIEEEIFYPAFRLQVADRRLVEQASAEHEGARVLIACIGDAAVCDPMVDARIYVLSEQIAQHIHEEETQLFPEARAADIDLAGLGGRLIQRKAELLRERAGSAADAEARSFRGGVDA